MSAAADAGVWLEAGALRAALRPDLGGSLSGLWWNENPVLRSVRPESLESPRQSAGFVMLPYSNRIGHCRFSWRGQAHSTAPNFGDHPHSLHGVGWQRAWQVTQATPNRARLNLRHEPDADWPFAFAAQQTLTVSEVGGEAAALHWALELHNTDSRPQPAGFGWHPYFARRSGSRLRATVSQRWAADAQQLPTHAEAHAPIDAPVASLSLDHCFDGWDGAAEIEDPLHDIRLTASTRRLVLFTPAPASTPMPTGAGHFCVEPVSHVNNAVQQRDPMAHGLVDLAPGERLAGWMQFDIRPTRRSAGHPATGQAPGP